MADNLRRVDLAVTRHRVRRLMRWIGRRTIHQDPKTSKPRRELRICPCRLGDVAIKHPDCVGCANTTYIPVRPGFLYLLVLMFVLVVALLFFTSIDWMVLVDSQDLNPVLEAQRVPAMQAAFLMVGFWEGRHCFVACLSG